MKRINVDGVLFEEIIFKTKFSCNYEDCHGACCNAPIGEELDGGELTTAEAQEIEMNKEVLAKYCEGSDKERALRRPIYSNNGTYYTSLVNGIRCVFCSIAEKSCVLKNAHKEGKLSFGIPLSCALYPLGVREIKYHKKTRKVVELLDLFERYCVSSYEKGERENVPIIQFLQEPLKRMFGETFYQKLWNIQLQYL